MIGAARGDSAGMMRTAAEAARGDAMRLVRADLCRRLDSLERRLARRGAVGAREEADRIAGISAEYGLASSQRVAEGLSEAIGAGCRGAAIRPWIDRLREATECDSPDAGDAWLASILVRFSS